MTVQDQMGRSIDLATIPRCIVSLVPSQTELLYDLGLEDAVAGITKFCIHPDHWFHSKTRVGGTKELHLEEIRHLRPDLIIANKEENDRGQLEILMQEFPVWVSDIRTLHDATAMIQSVGEFTGKREKAIEMAKEIERRFKAFHDLLVSEGYRPPLRTAYFIWRNPWMVAGGNTFVNDLMERCGFLNVFTDQTRYPIVGPDALQKQAIELILLSSEPYPFKEKHAAELQTIQPESKIIFVDGEMFSWYGSHLLQSPDYFIGLTKGLSRPAD